MLVKPESQPPVRAPTAGFPNLFDSRPPCLDTEDFATPKHFFYQDCDDYLEIWLIIIVVFYDDFPFPYWKETHFYFYICLGDPLYKAPRPPGWEILSYGVSAGKNCLIS